MGLFRKDKNDNLSDYLDKTVDKAEIKAICSNEINEIKFMKLALYIVSSYIASAISTCEFKILNKKNTPIKDVNYYKLNVAPNPNETATKLKYILTKKLIEEGNSLVVQYRNYLYVAESFTLANDSILGYEFDNISVKNEIINKKFNHLNSFYFELDDEKVKNILSLINSKYETMLSNAMKVYRKSISNKWKLKIDTVKQHDPKFQDEFENYVKTNLKEFLTSDESVYPELNGYTLEHIDDGESKTDSSDIRNLRKDIFDMVAESFRMPPSMMYGNISNLKEVVNQFISFTIKPIAKMIGEEITRTLFTQKEVIEGKRIFVDISSINYKDIFDVADSVEKLISDGISNIDEVREMINLPIIDSEFSKQHWMTKNYAKIEDMLNSEIDNSNNNSNVMKGGDAIEE